MKKLQERFQSITKQNWIVIIAMSVICAFGLYMSIAFSVKLAQGFTLFGDSSETANVLETSGPTSADISVLILYWVLSLALLALDIFFLFFKNQKEDIPTRKEIVDGKAVLVKEEEKHDETSGSAD